MCATVWTFYDSVMYTINTVLLYCTDYWTLLI